MTDAVVFTNNATSRLGIPVPAASITITVETGTGVRFPAPGAGQFFPVIINDRRTNQFEIAYCTQRINDILTVTRAQEGTTAQDWLLGASVWSTATAGVFTTYFNYGYSQDEANARFVNVAGDVMTGALTLSGAPTIDLHAVTKLYADSHFVDVTGDIMTGPLVLPGSPTLPLQATTKGYVDALVGTITSLTEAPSDGNSYARRNLAWIQTITKATYDADAFALDARIDADELNISTLQTQMALRITDAPSNGNEYVRKNGAWSILGAAITDAPNDGQRYVRQSLAWTAYTPAVLLAQLLTVDGAGSGLDADLLDGVNSAAFALLAGPTFTGVPAAPTAAPGTNTTQLATTAFVTTSFLTIATAAATYAPLASPALTGNPTAPTAAPGDNDTSVATTAFVTAAAALKADLASPTFTGDPKAPTPATGDADTSIATTAMVQLAINAKALRYDVVQGLAAAPRAVARANTGLVIAPQARLSLSSNDAISVVDLTAQTTVRLWPFQGELVPVWSVTDGEFKTPVLAVIGLALDNNPAHTNYQGIDRNCDLFAFLNAGVLTLGSGPSWNVGAVAGSDVARGTGAGSTELELWHGLRVNKNLIAMKTDASAATVNVAAREATYIGTMRATADGQTEDSQAKRFLSNGYAVNRIRRHMVAADPTNSWSYAVATMRQANANVANQLDYVQGTDAESVDASVSVFATSTVASTLLVTAIGLDSTTAAAPGCIMTPDYWVGSADPACPRAEYRGNPGLGRHRLTWLEYSQASGIVTWYGDNNTPLLLQSGITGSVFA